MFFSSFPYWFSSLCSFFLHGSCKIISRLHEESGAACRISIDGRTVRMRAGAGLSMEGVEGEGRVKGEEGGID